MGNEDTSFPIDSSSRDRTGAARSPLPLSAPFGDSLLMNCRPYAEITNGHAGPGGSADAIASRPRLARPPDAVIVDTVIVLLVLLCLIVRKQDLARSTAGKEQMAVVTRPARVWRTLSLQHRRERASQLSHISSAQ